MKRKHSHRKRPAIRPSIEEEQQRLLEQLVHEIPTSLPEEIVQKVPNALVAQHLVELLPSQDAVVPFLRALKEGFQDKNVRKAVKRSIFKLKQKGVSADALLSDGDVASSILKPAQKEAPLCSVGPVNGAGIRAVTLMLHRGGKGFDVGFAVLCDREGFHEFLFRTVGRKDAKELKEQFEAEAGPFIETTLAHGATLMEEAYRTQLSLKGSVPREYLELRPWLLAHASLLERPIVYDLIPEGMDSEYALTEAAIRDLFDDPLMETWSMEPGAIRPFVEEIYRVNDSPIVLTPIQKAARIREIQDKCLTAVFTPEERRRVKARLEEMAYLFLKLGQEETARTAIAAAHVAEQEATALRANPVMEIFLQRALSFYKNFGEQRLGDTPSSRTDGHSPILLA